MALSSRPTIGLFTPSTTSPWASRQWEGFAQGARDLDVDLIGYIGGVLRSSRYDEQSNVLYDLAVGKGLDGLAIWTTAICWNVSRREIAEFLGRYRRVPMVSLEMEFPGIPSVTMDDYQGMGAVVSHLIEAHGCRRIAFLRGAVTHEGAEKRFRAYVAALEAHGLAYDPGLVPPPSDIWDGGAMMRTLLEGRRADFDAIVAVNDTMMLEVLPLIKAKGIRVPEDVAIATFDNLPEGMWITPPLTTADPPFREMGRRAVEILLAQLSGQAVPELECMPIGLVLRESCGCAPSALRKAAEASAAAEAEGFDEGIDQGSLAGLTEAFAAGVGEEGGTPFLSALNDRLGGVAAADGDVFGWLRVPASLRRMAAPWLEGQPLAARRRADELCDRGRALVGEIGRRAVARREFQFMSRETRLRSVSETLSAAFDEAALMAIAAREFPELGIAGCFLSLYSFPEKPEEEARLILAYDEGGPYELPPGGVAFAASQLIPREYWREGRRASRLVLALCSQSERIGFVVFDLRQDADSALCETLRLQLSGALLGSILMQREKALAREKETYLRELQHRVKNSMGIISSIVSIEASAASAPETRSALDKLGSRITALGALYDTLYDTGAVERVDLADYLGRVVDSAAESLGSDTRGVAVDRSIAHFMMDLKRAVSCGLIVNELVTDSLKHAFPGGRIGRVAIRLEREEGGLRLEVSDDGIGLPPDFELGGAAGFGFNLVALLVKQLEGSVSTESREGTRVSIAFPE